MEKEGISIEIKEFPTVFPINEAEVIASAIKCGTVITLEDNVVSGGFGEKAALVLATHGHDSCFKAFGFPNEPIVHGSIAELDKKYGIDADAVADYIRRNLKNGKNKT